MSLQDYQVPDGSKSDQTCTCRLSLLVVVPPFGLPYRRACHHLQHAHAASVG
jgi:hypothetical protein